MNNYISKDISAGEKRITDLNFVPATDFELKMLGDDLPEGYIAGWASTPDIDRSRDMIIAGAFDESIAAKGLTGPKSIKLLLNHDWKRPAGIIRKLETRDGKLWIEAQLNLDVSYVKDFHIIAKMVGGMNFSVGFRVLDFRFEEINGTEIFIIEKAELFEVSGVPVPDNEAATMDFIKSNDDNKNGETLVVTAEEIRSMSGMEKALVANGFAKSRNEASRLTDFLKSRPELFVKEQEEQPTASPLSAEAIKSIRGQLAKMTEMLQT